MGMFDNITYEAPCLKCAKVIKGFQSKSGERILSELTPKQLYRVAKAKRKIDRIYSLHEGTTSEPTFYTSCDYCGTWNEYTFKPSHLGPPKIVPLHKHYTDDPTNKKHKDKEEN